MYQLSTLFFQTSRIARVGINFEQISIDELRNRLRGGKTMWLDARPVEEYAAGHLPGAISMLVNELERRLSDVPR